MVWNTNGAFPLGMYYWDGNQWNLIGQNTNTTVVPVTAVAVRAKDTIEATFTDTLNVIKFTPSNATNQSVTWTTSDAATVQIVSQTGTGVFLQTLKPGAATITATAAGTTVKATTAITVTSHTTCPDTVRGVDFPVNPTAFYKVGDFGLAGCWTTENLRDSTNTGATLNQGNFGTDATAANLKHYAYPNKEKANVATLGLLYTWAAATKRTGISANEGNTDQPNVQGICPNGWHIPSDKEYSDLSKVIANDATQRYSTTAEQSAWDDSYYSSTGWFGIIGTKMKSTTAVLLATKGTSNPYNAADITKRGFDGLLVGNVGTGNTLSYGYEAYHWSSSSANGTQSWAHVLSHQLEGAFRGPVHSKAYQRSIRCKKN
jgi:uncharacterized protein (TIGR02145 family)